MLSKWPCHQYKSSQHAQF
jgi:hypothetical protein